MKHLCSILIVFTIGLGITSCQNKPNKANSIQFFKSSDELYSQMDINKKQKIQSKKIEFKTVKDPQKNMPVYFFPIPSDWTINDSFGGQDNILIKGPNNLKIYGDIYNQFFYSSDPYVNQDMQQKGHKISPLKTAEQVIKETIVPLAKTIGLELIKTYELPKLVTFDKNIDQYIFKYKPEPNKIFDALASEWIDNKGTSTLMILRYGAVADQYQQVTWDYYMQSMDCDTKHFEQAKQDYLYALENTKYNPDWIKSNYLRDAEASASLEQIHQKNMGELRAHAEAVFQRNKEYNRTVDRNHDKFMDMQLERTNVITTAGELYKVDAGSKYYWMNSDGQYISSDNPNYNPNTDPIYNNRSWNSTTISNN